MDDKLCTSDRRISILNYLIVRKQTTRNVLAKRYSVSITTITNDIAHLSRYAPIYTKTGGSGGIYILPEHTYYNHYLNEVEEECLFRVKKFVGDTDKKIIEDIIFKFSHTVAYDTS